MKKFFNILSNILIGINLLFLCAGIAASLDPYSALNRGDFLRNPLLLILVFSLNLVFLKILKIDCFYQDKWKKWRTGILIGFFCILFGIIFILGELPPIKNSDSESLIYSMIFSTIGIFALIIFLIFQRQKAN